MSNLPFFDPSIKEFGGGPFAEPVPKSSYDPKVARDAAEDLGWFYGVLYNLGKLPLGIWAKPNHLSQTDYELVIAVSHVFGNQHKKSYVHGTTDLDGRYAAAYNAVIPWVHKAAQQYARDSLRTQEDNLWRLYVNLQGTDVSDHLHKIAQRVSERVGGFEPNDREWSEYNRRSGQNVYPPKNNRIRWKQTITAPTTVPLMENLIRKRVAGGLRQELAQVGYKEGEVQWLATLFAHPTGLDIIAAYAKSSEANQVALGLVRSAALATLEFRETLSQNPDQVWRYPVLIVGGVTRLGLQDVANFSQFAVALGQVLGKSGWETALNEAAKVLFFASLAFSGPVAIAFGALDLALTGGNVALTYMREREQELAAKASSLAAAEDRLAVSTGFGETILGGATALASALFLLKGSKEWLLKKNPRKLNEVIPPEEIAATKSKLPKLSDDPTATIDRAIESKGTQAEATATQPTATVNQSIETGASGLSTAKAEAPSVNTLEKTRSTHDRGIAASGTEIEAKGNELTDFDAEIEGLRPDPTSFTKEEVEEAKLKLKLQESILEIKVPKFEDIAVTQSQKETFGRLTGRLFADQGQRTAPKAVDAARAELLRRAELDAANLRARIEVHWSTALPRRGKQTAEDAAYELLQEISKTTPTSSQANQFIRNKFFATWRNRFLNSVSRDPKLMDDLRVQAGVIFNRNAGVGGNAFSVPFRDASGIQLVGLDIDHAIIRHEQAVIDALRTNDARHLLSTVDGKNLQFITERENRNFIEELRKQDRSIWSAPQQTASDSKSQ